MAVKWDLNGTSALYRPFRAVKNNFRPEVKRKKAVLHMHNEKWVLVIVDSAMQQIPHSTELFLVSQGTLWRRLMTCYLVWSGSNKETRHIHVLSTDRVNSLGLLLVSKRHPWLMHTARVSRSMYLIRLTSFITLKTQMTSYKISSAIIPLHAEATQVSGNREDSWEVEDDGCTAYAQL